MVATLSDPDGGVILSRWTWATSDALTAGQTCAADATNFVDVTPDVSSGAYTPKEADNDKCLRAAATYTDDITDPDPNTAFDDLAAVDGTQVVKVSEFPVQLSEPDNAAPKFQDQDLTTDGDQSDETTRSVPENMADENVGGPIAATDDDGDAMMFTVSDNDNFKTDNNGQIKTKVKLDYETQDTYVVALTATDPSGASDSIMVTITVIDGPDDAVIVAGPAVNDPPAFDSASATRSVGENMPADTAVGDPVPAMDDATDTVTYSISGSDYFAVDSNGQITTTMMLDYEAMTSHSVTVTATDSEDQTDTIDVTINVINAHTGCDTVGGMGLVNDCEALLDSKDTLGGALNWTDHTHTPITEWDGVKIDVDSMRVTEINLRDQGLDGTIPAALGRVEMLTKLNLRSNADLSGEIPAELGDLMYLTVLNLHSNSHTGEIPDLSGTSLEQLYLTGNDLTGSVPASLNMLTGLTQLWLTGNDLSGAMPDLSGTSLDKLKVNGNAVSGLDDAMLPMSLRWLVAGETDTGGTMPDLRGLTNLTTLWLNKSGLTGQIAVANIPANVRVLNLRDNALDGTIPDLSGLGDLLYLYLNSNELSGDIPGTLGDLGSITRIWLHQNDLTGISAALANAADTLTHLYLAGNSFAEGTCLAGGLMDVENNDFEDAGLAACANGN